MDKTAIKNFAIEARKILMKSAVTEAGFYGITESEIKEPTQKGNDFEVYETVARTENRIYKNDIRRRANLVKAIQTQGFEQVIEETAYTWFNRIIAIRFMEVNNYLPTRVRVLSSEAGGSTPDIITQSDTVELGMKPEEIEQVKQYVAGCNKALAAGALSKTGRVSTKGRLRRQASRSASRERKTAIREGRPYSGQAGHVPDTTWTNNPEPFSWLDLDERVNTSLGAQSKKYSVGYKPTEFVYKEDD